jgi:hypothetical protein
MIQQLLAAQAAQAQPGSLAARALLDLQGASIPAGEMSMLPEAAFGGAKWPTASL